MEHDDRPILGMRQPPERLTDEEWLLHCMHANMYRALTPSMSAMPSWITLFPKIVVWCGGGPERKGLAATHPIFTCAVDLDGLLGLAMWQGVCSLLLCRLFFTTTT